MTILPRRMLLRITLPRRIGRRGARVADRCNTE
jgi:hypothetical protein